MAEKPAASLKKTVAEARAWLDDSATAALDYTKFSSWQKFIHFCALVARSFTRNRCPVRASALAYTTLLALIPLLAVVVSVYTSFIRKQGERPVHDLIEGLVARVAPQLDLVSTAEGAGGTDGRKELVRNITHYIANIRSGTLGVTGTLALIFVGISLLSTIETTFNDIWGVERGRSWFNRVVHYWAVISLGPLVLLLAIGLTSGPQFTAIKQQLEALPWIGSFLFALLPFVLLSGAFTVFYQLMPNTRVQWRAALAGGVVGGCLWQFNNLFNVIYLSRVVSYSKIYGSLGILPIFLIGMYFSWLILLLGAQVAYAFQNRRAYLQQRQADQISQRGREFVALRVMTEVAREFLAGRPAPTVDALSGTIGAPTRFIAKLASVLTNARLLVEVAGEATGYAPARPLESISAKDVLEALRSGHGVDLETRAGPDRDQLEREFGRIEDVTAQVAGTVTLDKLVARMDSAGTPPG